MPFIIAQVFLSGFPIEIMDGDAGGVPIQWIKAVFNNVSELITDKKVFVLSVIGIQSSGKSTLLNALLGSEFAVSAGRCTRGIFAQLFPVDKTNFNVRFDYFLVLDSEGLCAPELARNMFAHDNMLAALVTCLSDLTFINVQGETIGKMDNVLEMTTQAMLRMNLANEDKKQRCMFIHQNVSSLNANEIMTKNLADLLADLDEMIKRAAKAEGKGDDWYFTKVIEFDSSKDICYMNDFLSGSRPLAPISSGYAKSIETLHTKILTRIVEEKPCCHTITEISNQLEDIWEALLSDNFVLTFQNIISIQAHIQLERAFTKFYFDSQVRILSEKRKITNELSKTSNLEMLEGVFQNGNRCIEDSLSKSYKDASSCLQIFIETSEYKHILIVNKDNKLRYLGGCLEEFSMEMKADLRKQYLQQQESLTNVSKMEQYKQNLVQQALTLANDFRGKKTSEECINKKFNTWWTEMSLQNTDIIDTELIRLQMEIHLLKKALGSGIKIESILPYLRGKRIKIESLERGINLHCVTENSENLIKDLKAKFFVHQIKEDKRKIAMFLNTSIFKLANSYLGLALIEGRQFLGSSTDFVDYVIDLCEKSKFSDNIQLSQFGKFAIAAICVHFAIKEFTQVVLKNDDYQYPENVKTILLTISKTLLKQFDINIQEEPIKAHIAKLDFDLISYDCWNGDVVKCNDSDIYIKDQNEKDVRKYLERASKEVKNILRKVHNKIDDICDCKNSTFCSSPALAFVQELLNYFEEFNNQNHKYAFTWECRAKNAVFVAQYAIPKFEAMNYRFEIRYGSKCKVEETRSHIKAFFRSQVLETEFTMSANVIFFAVLRNEAFYFLQTKIEDQVTRKFLTKIGFSKYDLMMQILKYLIKQKDFESYKNYLQNSFEFSLEWVKAQKDKFAFDKRDGEISVYDATTDRLIEDLKKRLSKAINEATEFCEKENSENTMSIWCDTFFKKCREFYLYIDNNDFHTLSRLNVRDISTLRECLMNDLSEFCDCLKSNFLEMGTLRTTGQVGRSINRIMDTLWGCREQCHFCGEPCKHTTKGHTEDHECLQHRPCGSIGVFFHDTKELSPLICTTAVAEEGEYICKNLECQHTNNKCKQKYKNYKQCLQRWNIKADNTVEVSKYWKWFMAKYKKELITFYDAKQCDIPSEWEAISEYDAVESLKRFQNI